MGGHVVGQLQAQKLSQRKGIVAPPSNPSLRIDPLEIPNAKTLKQINQQRGKKVSKPRTELHQTFVAECGITASVSSKSKANYQEVEQALLEALDEVRLRINNNVQIF